MDKKYIIIIVAIIAVIAIAGAYFFLFNNQLESEHSTFVLSKSAYMETPVAKNVSAEPDKDGVYYYVDKENGVNITSCSNISKSDSADKMNKLKDSVETNSKKSYENDVVVYEKEGVYSIFVKNVLYNDSILIQSISKDLLLNCWATLKFHDPSDSLKFDNTTAGGGTVINGAEQTEKVVQSSTTTSSSSSTSDYSSNWGYDWNSGSSGGSGGSKHVGGSASVNRYDV
jgi:uncharacterized membrane protein YgcG